MELVHISRFFFQLISVGSLYDGPFSCSFRSHLSLTIRKSPVTTWPTSLFWKLDSQHEHVMELEPLSKLMSFTVFQNLAANSLGVLVTDYWWSVV